MLAQGISPQAPVLIWLRRTQRGPDANGLQIPWGPPLSWDRSQEGSLQGWDLAMHSQGDGGQSRSGAEQQVWSWALRGCPPVPSKCCWELPQVSSWDCLGPGGALGGQGVSRASLQGQTSLPLLLSTQHPCPRPSAFLLCSFLGQEWVFQLFFQGRSGIWAGAPTRAPQCWEQRLVLGRAREGVVLRPRGLICICELWRSTGKWKAVLGSTPVQRTPACPSKAEPCSYIHSWLPCSWPVASKRWGLHGFPSQVKSRSVRYASSHSQADRDLPNQSTKFHPNCWLSSRAPGNKSSPSLNPCIPD